MTVLACAMPSLRSLCPGGRSDAPSHLQQFDLFNSGPRSPCGCAGTVRVVAGFCLEQRTAARGRAASHYFQFRHSWNARRSANQRLQAGWLRGSSTRGRWRRWTLGLVTDGSAFALGHSRRVLFRLPGVVSVPARWCAASARNPVGIVSLYHPSSGHLGAVAE